MYCAKFVDLLRTNGSPLRKNCGVRQQFGAGSDALLTAEAPQSGGAPGVALSLGVGVGGAVGVDIGLAVIQRMDYFD
jgi:hypothetical protein